MLFTIFILWKPDIYYYNSVTQNISAFGRSTQHWKFYYKKGFIIPTFCIPYANFKVDEDRLGSNYTPTYICLFICVTRWLEQILCLTVAFPLSQPFCQFSLLVVMSICCLFVLWHCNRKKRLMVDWRVLVNGSMGGQGLKRTILKAISTGFWQSCLYIGLKILRTFILWQKNYMYTNNCSNPWYWQYIDIDTLPNPRYWQCIDIDIYHCLALNA